MVDFVFVIRTIHFLIPQSVLPVRSQQKELAQGQKFS